MIKYLNADLSIGEKINICKIYTYYKNILAIKNITDECHFLNLSNMFFKKILKGKFVTEYTIKNKMYSSECNEKLNSFTYQIYKLVIQRQIKLFVFLSFFSFYFFCSLFSIHMDSYSVCSIFLKTHKLYLVYIYCRFQQLKHFRF